MIKTRKNSLILLVMLALVVAGFCFLHQTTPERIGSLIFFVLVAAYSLSTQRNDVLGASVAFFAMVDVNRYLFDFVLPVWLGVLTMLVILFILWRVLFGRLGWFLAVASALVVLELILATQFINIEPNFLALLIVAPFILISQQYYFQTHRPSAPE